MNFLVEACQFCEMNTAGEHVFNCPNHPNNRASVCPTCGGTVCPTCGHVREYGRWDTYAKGPYDYRAAGFFDS